jgi:hypothetical protein
MTTRAATVAASHDLSTVVVSDSVLKRCREEHMLLDIDERRAKAHQTNLDVIKARMEMVAKAQMMHGAADRLYFKDLIMKSGDVAIPVAAIAAGTVPSAHGREITVELVCAELGLDIDKYPGASDVIESTALVRWYEDLAIHNGRLYLDQYFQVDYGMLAACCREVLAD